MNFKLIDKINIGSYKKILKGFKEKDWNRYRWRQQTEMVHRDTLTIPLIFDSDFRLKNPTYWKDYNKFKKQIKTLENILTKIFGNGIIIRALLIQLKMKSFIKSHIDQGESLSVCHRIHIPIITNNKVFFTVDNETKNLKEGELWEINNAKKYHSVQNKSRYSRTHLVVDWITDDY